VLVKFLEAQFLQRLGVAHGLEMRTGGLRAFDYESVQSPCYRQRFRWQAGLGINRAERDRNQVEGA
jgi:hypothetical protein